MKHSPERESEFKEEFASRRKRQLIATGVALLAIPIPLTIDDQTGTALGGSTSSTMAVAIMLTWIGAVLVFSLFNWRCPACTRYLGKGINPRFCSNCGVALR